MGLNSVTVLESLSNCSASFRDIFLVNESKCVQWLCILTELIINLRI